MPRVIYCDIPGCETAAAYMLTDVQEGETQGMCGDHYIAHVMGIAQSVFENVGPNQSGEGPAVGSPENPRTEEAQQPDEVQRDTDGNPIPRYDVEQGTGEPSQAPQDEPQGDPVPDSTSEPAQAPESPQGEPVEPVPQGTPADPGEEDAEHGVGQPQVAPGTPADPAVPPGGQPPTARRRRELVSA